MQKKALRSYVKRKDDPDLCRAVSLVLDQGMSVGQAVRLTKVAKTTLRSKIERRKNLFSRSASKPSVRRQYPERDTLDVPQLEYAVPSPYSALYHQTPATTGNSFILNLIQLETINRITGTSVVVSLPLKLAPQAVIQPFFYRSPQAYEARESRKSYSVVPMSAIRQTLGAYWDDRNYRSIAHK